MLEFKVPGTGITYSREFEIVLAAQWRGISDIDFEKLSGDKQARVVAAYRSYVMMQAVTEQEHARDARARARRNQSQSGG